MDENADKGLEWQVGIWDRMADVYQVEIDRRFVPIVEHVVAKGGLAPGQSVIDLGSGTGAVAFAAADRVGPDGRVTAVDISPDMLARVRAGAQARSLSNVECKEGRGESIPAGDQSQDVVLASLSMMYVIDRAAAAREIARVLRPGGRFVASVWAGPDDTDIVRFQQGAGRFAPEPPVPGVGPGALADPAPFVAQLTGCGLQVDVETKITQFDFPDFQSAWSALAAVTTAGLSAEVQNDARSSVQKLMWTDSNAPRTFRNATHFITATR